MKDTRVENRLWRQLLCFFGGHQWWNLDSSGELVSAEIICRGCGAQQIFEWWADPPRLTVRLLAGGEHE